MPRIIFTDYLKGTLIVPIALALILVPLSLLIGWSLITLFLFWFVVIPSVAIYLPSKISKNKYHLVESLTGLVIFYGSIVFLIYDHYKTDYFKIMILSCMINLLLVTVVTHVTKKDGFGSLKEKPSAIKS
jgi:hypothetical protein